MSDKPTEFAKATTMVKGQVEDAPATPNEVEETTVKTEDVKVDEGVDEATQNIIDNANGDTTKLASQIRTKDAAYNTARQDAEKAQTALYEQKKKTVEESPYYLLDLHKDDPEAAERIAQDIWEIPFAQIEEQMYKKKDEDKTPDTSELVKREVEKELRSYKKESEEQKTLDECEKLIEDFKASNSLDPALEAKVVAEYRFYAQGKELTPEIVSKLLTASYISVTGKKPGLPNLEETVIENAAMNVPQGQQPTAPKKRATTRQKEVANMFTAPSGKAFGQ